MKNIVLITENFQTIWRPKDIETFLAGSQECVVLLAEAFQRLGHTVNVFLHGPTKSVKEEYNQVNYDDFSNFSVSDFTTATIILFKINPLPVDDRLNNVNVIFWSSDVQKTVQPNRYIKKYVCLTDFHRKRNEWPNALVIPHGVDLTSLNANRAEKEHETMIYCSSPDRGLPTVLSHFNLMKRFHPDLKLYITYGFKIVKQILGQCFSQIRTDEISLQNICAAEADRLFYCADLPKNELEKRLWKSKYWVLPLGQADSELFCISAVKAQYCGCIPVIFRKGALNETVGQWIDFTDFVNGERTPKKSNNIVPTFTWDEVVDLWWKNII